MAKKHEIRFAGWDELTEAQQKEFVRVLNEFTVADIDIYEGKVIAWMPDGFEPHELDKFKLGIEDVIDSQFKLVNSFTDRQLLRRKEWCPDFIALHKSKLQTEDEIYHDKIQSEIDWWVEHGKAVDKVIKMRGL